MLRNNILDTTKRILHLLKKGEYSINEISVKSKIQWKTAIKSLKFLKEIGLVKEKKGKSTYRSERLFSLKKNAS